MVKIYVKNKQYVKPFFKLYLQEYFFKNKLGRDRKGVFIKISISSEFNKTTICCFKIGMFFEHLTELNTKCFNLIESAIVYDLSKIGIPTCDDHDSIESNSDSYCCKCKSKFIIKKSPYIIIENTKVDYIKEKRVYMYSNY